MINFQTVERCSRVLLISMPLAIVAGKAPTEVFAALIALAFFLKTLLHRDYEWLHQPWVKAGLMFWAYLVVRGLFAENAQDC